MKKLLIISSLLFLSAGTAWSKISLKPAGYVNDFAGVLNETDKLRIETLLQETEKKTTAEVAVVTINSLEGANLEEFANELFNNWGIGKKGKDNGLLILVVKNERKIRIETGYGLESILPDGKCGELIRQVLTPTFRKGEFGDGLFRTVELIAGIIGGENVSIPSSDSAEGVPVGFLIPWLTFCFLFTLAAAGAIGLSVQVVYLLSAFILNSFFIRKMELQPNQISPFLFLIIPFLLTFGSGIVGSIVMPYRLKKIKKRYGRDWRNHWYWWYGSSSCGSSSGGGSGFGGGGGGFGGGGGGGGGASGGW